MSIFVTPAFLREKRDAFSTDPALAELRCRLSFAGARMAARRFPTVTAFRAPMGDDSHAYYTEAPYQWPVPGTAGQYVYRDGERYPGAFTAHKDALRLWCLGTMTLSSAGWYVAPVSSTPCAPAPPGSVISSSSPAGRAIPCSTTPRTRDRFFRDPSASRRDFSFFKSDFRVPCYTVCKPGNPKREETGKMKLTKTIGAWLTAGAVLLGAFAPLSAFAADTDATHKLVLSSAETADGWTHAATLDGKAVTEYDYVWHADPSTEHKEEKNSPAEYHTGEEPGDDAVYIAHDVVYYPELDSALFKRVNYDGEQEWVYYYTAAGYEEYIFSTLPVSGDSVPTSMMHSEAEAYENAVLHITEAGVYELSGTWHGQIWIDLGDTDDTFADPDAKVTLILNGVNVTCTVAPALVFYSVYECDNAWEDAENHSPTVDTSDAGAVVLVADGSDNSFSGTNVFRLLKTKYKDETSTEAVKAQKKRFKLDGAFYSYVSMNVEGGALGDGILRIESTYEGLDSELHLTFNGGRVYINSGDDGINVNEDGVSVLTVNGGELHIVAGIASEGDGVDSNGWLVINGGTVISAASPIADSGLDSDFGSYVNGGYVVATGSTMDWAETDSAQVTMNLQFANYQSNDEAIVVTTADGAVVFAYDPDKDETTGSNARSYQGAVISSPEFKVGETYYVYVGGDVEGTETNGLYDVSTVTGFTGATRQQYTGTDVGGFGMGRMMDPGGFGGQQGADGQSFPQGMQGMTRPEDELSSVEGLTIAADGSVTMTDEAAQAVLALIQTRNPSSTATLEQVKACATVQALMQLMMGGGRGFGGMGQGGQTGFDPFGTAGTADGGTLPTPPDGAAGGFGGFAQNGQADTGEASVEFYMTDTVNAFSGVSDEGTEVTAAAGSGQPGFPGGAPSVDPGGQTMPGGDSFTDVDPDEYYAEAITWAVGNGFAWGAAPQTFGVDVDCTRAEFVTFLWRAAGSPAASAATDYTDVPSDAWYAQAVAWAAEYGITFGTGETTFGPEESLTRAQAVTFLWRLAGCPSSDAYAAFADVAAGDFFADAVGWALTASVTTGTSATEFSPDDPLTRAQAVTFLWRAYR